MQDRDMVNDILAGTKSSINVYTHAIMESSNQQLRNTLIQLRDEAEKMQYQIYQMAEQKGWYMPAPQANQSDVNKIKTSLSSAVNTMNTATNANTNNFDTSNMSTFKPIH